MFFNNLLLKKFKDARINDIFINQTGGGKRAASGQDNSKEDLIGEKTEELRIGLLRFNNENDVTIMQTKQNIETFKQNLATHPDSIIKNALATLSIENLGNLNKIAAMGNHKQTMKSLAKFCYEADYISMTAKSNNLNYAKESCLTSVELAFIAQYHDGRALNQSQFKDDISAAILNIGRAQGVAAAQQAAAA